MTPPVLNLPKPVAIIDGGLATELEDTHHKSLSSRLWSASMLDKDPEAIKSVHRSYLEAGADIITTSTYQASIPGFLSEGYTEEQSEKLMLRSITLAIESCNEFMKTELGKERIQRGRGEPLIALSGTGHYEDATDTEITTYHTTRLETLSTHPSITEINLLLFETIPTLREANLISSLLSSSSNPLIKNTPSWISFRGKENGKTGHGEYLYDCVVSVISNPWISGVGVNCTHPKYVSELLHRAKRAMVDSSAGQSKVLFCYPNSGEDWDEEKRGWVRELGEDEISLVKWAEEWVELGVGAVGGCCRISPKHIAELAKRWGN
ncbi:hypothetical protein HDU76_004585 [Blyttiomyces sp. JEL0837]|nr:hypothetical protein HDU76_004585 [Blyttiomyces sp. JEL0837]